MSLRSVPRAARRASATRAPKVSASSARCRRAQPVSERTPNNQGSTEMLALWQRKFPESRGNSATQRVSHSRSRSTWKPERSSTTSARTPQKPGSDSDSNQHQTRAIQP